VRISSRCEYGLRAMVYLAGQTGEAPVPLPEIASSEAIPTAFLERIFARLRDGGLVRATRGVSGGYRLAKGPAEISVADVIEAVEGPLCLVGCLPDGGACARSIGCASRQVWRRLDEVITEALTAITLSDLTMEAATR